MLFTFTSLTYLIGFLVFCSYVARFYRLWKESGTIISKMFFLLGLSFCLFALITLLGSLFFANDPQILKLVVVFATFMQSFTFGFLAYLAVHIGGLKISPRFAFIAIFILGIIATIVTALSSFSPFLDSDKGIINWNYPSASRILRGLIGLIAMVPLIVVFLKKGLAAQDKKVRRKAISFALTFLAGLLVILFAFFFSKGLGGLAIGEDVVMLILCFAILGIVVSSPKQERPRYVKKIYEE